MTYLCIAWKRCSLIIVCIESGGLKHFDRSLKWGFLGGGGICNFLGGPGYCDIGELFYSIVLYCCVVLYFIALYGNFYLTIVNRS